MPPLTAGSSEIWTWSALVCALLVIGAIGLRFWLNRRSRANAKLRSLRTDGTLSPRAHHYYFAHAALRNLATEAPDQLVLALCSPDGDAFLRRVWDEVGNEFASAGHDAPILSHDGLETISARVAGRPCALIKLPPPSATTEAHFVAIVLNHEIDEPPKSPGPGEPQVYYVTLEKGFTLEGEPRTVFCEWTAESHQNYGDGPPPDARLFLDQIADHLRTRTTSTAVPP
jgi:hypothetical protein